MKIHADKFEVASALFGQNAESYNTVTFPALTNNSVLHRKRTQISSQKRICTLHTEIYWEEKKSTDMEKGAE